MADPTRKRYDLRLNVSTDATHNAMLDQLAIEGNVSKAAIVRASIRAAFETVFNNAPHCANGGKCLCPQMHVSQPQPHQSIEDTVRRIELGRRPEPAA